MCIIIFIIIIINYNEDMGDCTHSADDDDDDYDVLTVKLISLARICFILNMQAFWDVT